MIAAVSSDPASGVGVLAAVAAGAVSFLSPCVLPLVPGYLTAVVGVAPTDLRRTNKWIAAVLIIALGAFFVANPVVVRLNREWHVDALVQRAGRGGPLVAGAAFAVAWTPCVGPTLGAILSAAELSSSAPHGAVLLAFYSAGLAIPFLVTALAFERMTSPFAAVKRHFRIVIGAGGIMLIAVGLLIWSGELFQLNIQAQNALNSLGLNFFNSI
jgi:cytochrome c-type biogenesis protein